MTSLGAFADGTTFKEITPQNYVEGPQMFKRGNKYYLMWSEGGWTGPNYAVSYAMSDSPTGPFQRIGRVLSQDPAVARGSGHNSVLTIPGTEIWYIFYHRRPLNLTDANQRQVSYDRMYFNPDGTIKPVTMLVKDDFGDDNAIGWQTYGGSWSASGGRYTASPSAGGKALLVTNFADLVYDADLTLTSGRGDAGVVFRATEPATGVDSYRGYYAGISRSGGVLLGRADNGWTPLADAPVRSAATYHLRVEAVGSSIRVYVDDLSRPALEVVDASYTSGANGVRVFNAGASFDDLAIAHR
jgi:hypothetical protein